MSLAFLLVLMPLTSKVTFQMPGPFGARSSSPRIRQRAIIKPVERAIRLAAVARQSVVRDIKTSSLSVVSSQ